MLTFFRRLINSRVGVIVTLGVLVVIALAFAAGDVSGLRTQGMAALAGDGVAKVGGETITATELRSRVQNEFDAARQQQPTLTMAQFVGGGGVDSTLQRLMTGMALARFGGKEGMVVSRRAVDGALASIPGLQGPNGQFDPLTYQRLLAERKLTDGQIRADLVQQTLAEQLTVPTIGASQVPAGLAQPYAALLLEKRQGQIGFVPTTALMTGAKPSDAELAAYYARNVARYTVPQRRVARYALVSADTVRAKAIPSDADVAAYYAAHKADYAAAEKRAVESVVAADQATANAIAAKVKGGTSVADAARGVGLEAAAGPARDKAAISAALSPSIADAVFAAVKGAAIGPVKGPLGFVVARVTAIDHVAGRSLDQARPDIVKELSRTKSLQALATTHDAIDDSLAHNATFDEIVSDQKLTAATTPALVQNGSDPDHMDTKPDPTLAPIMQAAFQAEDGDAPQLVTIGKEGTFALVGLARIVPAAPRPLASIHDAVAHDYAIEQARVAARRAAAAIVAKANAGTPFTQAMAAGGVKTPPIKPVATTRADLVAARGNPPAPLVLLFSMNAGTTRLLEAPGNAGYFLVRLDRIEPGNAASNPALIASTAADLGRIAGREYAEQFARAVGADQGASVDAAALARFKADLVSNTGGSNNR
jgi:peptidyl-prolyl cis-trans isomerase D